MATTYYDAINDGETILSNTLDIGEVTSFVVNDGSQLPVGGAGTSGFIIKLEDTSGNREYIKCSSRSGNTVYIANRGFEGTFARTWIAGSYLKNVFTKTTKDEITDKILVQSDASITGSINIKTIEEKDGTVILPRTIAKAVDYDNTTSGLTATSVQAGIDELDSVIDVHLADNTSKIGDLLYTENNYITDSEPLTDSVDKLDMKLKDTNDNIGDLLYTENNYVADGESLSASVDKLDQAVFDKALKGSGTATSLTSLLNGWTGTIKHKKSEGGIVTLILNISNASPSSLQEILNLPVGVRPEVETVIPVVAPTTGVIGNVYINLSGNIRTVSGSTLSAGLVYHGEISYGV